MVSSDETRTNGRIHALIAKYRSRYVSRQPDLGSAGQMKLALERLRDSGVEISAAIDVGAFRAQWTVLLREVYPSARSLLIEPQSRHTKALEMYTESASAHTLFVPALVGAVAADDVGFHVLDDEYGGSGSSIMPERSNIDGHEERMPMTTLLNILNETNFGLPQMVKVDVQGYELEVMKGLGELISSIDFVLLEVAIIQYNEGAPSFTDVLQWMDVHGLVPYDIVGETRLPNGSLAQIDVLFAQRNHSVRNRNQVVEF